MSSDISSLVAQARDARERARNFESIGHRALADQWRRYAVSCMLLARQIKSPPSPDAWARKPADRWRRPDTWRAFSQTLSNYFKG